MAAFSTFFKGIWLFRRLNIFYWSVFIDLLFCSWVDFLACLWMGSRKYCGRFYCVIYEKHIRTNWLHFKKSFGFGAITFWISSNYVQFDYDIWLNIWFKVFKNGPSKICGRQPFKNLKWYGLPQQTISFQMFKRLSSTNFTRSILEHVDPFDLGCRYRFKMFCMSCGPFHEKRCWPCPISKTRTDRRITEETC